MGMQALRATDIAPRRLGGCRVLVVDDSEDAAACLTALLRLNGFDALTTRTGADALEKLREHKPGAMVLDLDLPDMDPCDVIQKATAVTNPYACPVIVVSAHTDASHRRAALATGAKAYFLKPTDPLALIRAIHECSTLG
jgi:DNA-binding response OmpR family regulator